MSIEKQYKEAVERAREIAPFFVEGHEQFLMVASDNTTNFTLACKRCGSLFKSNFGELRGWTLQSGPPDLQDCTRDGEVLEGKSMDKVDWELARIGEGLMQRAGLFPVLQLTEGDVRTALGEFADDEDDRPDRPEDPEVIWDALQLFHDKHEFHWQDAICSYVDRAREMYDRSEDEDQKAGGAGDEGEGPA